MKCLSKGAEERYQTGFELADALLAFLRNAAPNDLRAAWLARRSVNAALASA
jgi:hypothetical protein